MTAQAYTYVISMAQLSVAILEFLGIAIIMVTTISATARNLIALVRYGHSEEQFHLYRLQLARGILLGLEFLVAADIIKTVAIELTFASVGILAVVVLIRTFLSFAIEMEMTGKWPWQKKRPTITTSSS